MIRPLAVLALILGLALATSGGAAAAASAEAVRSPTPTATPAVSAKKHTRQAALSEAQIIKKLHAKGYKRVWNVKRGPSGVYTALAKKKRGHTLRLRVNARNGAVISARRV